MAANEIHVGDIGTVFRLTVYEGANLCDISAATIKTIKFIKPSGTLLSKAGTFTTNGTDAQYQYAFAADDLDEAGDWQAQGYLVLPDWSGHTDIVTFKVHGNLS